MNKKDSFHPDRDTALAKHIDEAHLHSKLRFD